MLEIGVRMKKAVIFSVKGCYRSICNHPFLVGMLCFLVFLYRSFPFLFSMLVSASPVLVCTAFLLGTLLSYGKPNIPEIEREESTTHDIASLRTGFSEGSVVIERNKSLSVERYSEKGKHVEEKAIEKTSSVDSETSKVGSDGSSGHSIEERSREMEFDDREDEEGQTEFQDFELENKSQLFEERLDRRNDESRYSLMTEVDDEHLDMENDRSPVGSVVSKVVNVDSLDSPPGSPWKHVDDEEEEEEDDEASDSGSDQAESSSPDASMADIIPMLDELHPLLDEDAPQPAHLTHDGSDAASERSDRSDESSNESDDDTENQDELEVADDDHEDGEEEEETQGDKEDQTKSAITWTEEDQKNLMDLGTSELERNQRLENLIARRRARKTMSTVTEKNLIDLDGSDLSFNVPPISTTRTNPFDLPQDSYENMGLPPIPGSAPSILLPRRNPFDIPYDSSEEKPDLMEDGFQQEFMPFQSKDPFFRRHESFNVRPTYFGINKPEKQEMSRFRPYFVPERLGSEGTSYSHLHRQSSELSDSKASSVPETESISSGGDSEDQNDPEMDVRIDAEEDITQEPELISKIEHASELVGHGSESSEEEDSWEPCQGETRHMRVDEIDMKLEDSEKHQEAGPSLETEQQTVGNRLENNFSGTHSTAEDLERKYSDISSSSSLSEESERIYVQKEAEEFPSFPEGDHTEEPSNSGQPSPRGSHLSISTSLTDDAPFKDPVYDLSPQAVQKNYSSSSISSDQLADSEIGLPPVVVKRAVSFSERVTELGRRDMESEAVVDKEMLDGISEVAPMDKSEIGSRGDLEITEHDVIPDNRENESETMPRGDVEMTGHGNVNCNFSASCNISDSATTSVVPETVLDHTSVDVNSSTESSPKETFMYEDATSKCSKSSDADTNVVPSTSTLSEEQNIAGSMGASDAADSQAVHFVSMPSDEQNLAGSKEELDSVNVEQGIPAPLDTLSSRSPSTAHDIIDGDFLLSPHQDHEEALESSRTESVVSIQEVSTSDSLNNCKVSESDNKMSPSIDIPTSPESITIPSEVCESRALAVEETDVIKEIDVELLSELDAIGDFRAKEGRKLNNHVESGGQVSSVQDEAESSTTLDEGNPTQSYEAEHLLHEEDIGSTIKESDEYDKNLKPVSEFDISETSAVDEIDHINSLEPISDAEAQSSKEIESVIQKADSTCLGTEAGRGDPEPSHLQSSLEETATGGSENEAVGNTPNQAEVEMETPSFEENMVKDLDLDLNKLPEDNAEQVPVSASVLHSDGAKDAERTSTELLLQERQSSDDSNAALNQDSESSQRAAEDVPTEVNSSEDAESGIKGSDMEETKQIVPVEPAEVKTPEGH